MPDIEEYVITIPDQVSGIPVGYMSFFTAVLFIITCISMICRTSSRRGYRNLSPIFGILVLSAGLIVIEGYGYNTPILYGGTHIPIALTTGFCFLFLGLSTLYISKNDTDLGESLFGESVKARLLRTFLPVMVLFVVIEGWLFSIITNSLYSNPVLWLSFFEVVSVLVIVIITTILSRQIGGVIDLNQAIKDQTERELRQSYTLLTDANKQLGIQEETLVQKLDEIASREEELRLQNEELMRRQIALERSENRYFELFNHISSGVIVYEAIESGENFIIRDLNRASEKIDQLQKSEIIGRTILEIFPAVCEFGIFQIFQQVWKTGIPRHYPIAFYKDNRISGWRDNYIYRLPSGEIVAVYDDVSDRKKSEVALKESEEKFKILADYTYDWETWESPGGELIYISPSCERITGYNSEEFLSHFVSLIKIVHPSDLKILEMHLCDEKTINEYFSLEFRIIRRDGEVKWIHHICQSIILPDGQNLGRRGSNRDVTIQKEMQESLIKKEAQYQLISENSADVIWLMDFKSLKLTYASPSVYKLRGYTPEEVMKQSFKDLLTPESFKLITEQLPVRLSRFLAGDESQRVQTHEVFQPHKNGTIISTEVVTTLIPGDNEEVVEVLGVSRDISERKKAESQIKMAVTQINQNLETLAILNDEIRNPLMVIELIADSVGGESAEKIHYQVLQIDNLIKQVDRGFIQSEKVRKYLTRHYNILFDPNEKENE